MATQTGITIEGPGKPYTVVDNIVRPTPGPNEALVKTLYVGLNPVDPIMHQTGLLIQSFPAVTGSDFCAVVLSVGPETSKIAEGDIVFGCAPVGINEFSPFQESFLVNENWILRTHTGDDALDEKKLEQGATVGAGLLTSGLGLTGGLKVELPASGSDKVLSKDEWLIVMGGSGSVGQFAVQLGKLGGYKVAASCSASKAAIAQKAGADATFDNRAPIDEQLGIIERITGGGRFAWVFDASAQSSDLSLRALDKIANTSPGAKYFSTVDDWSDIKTPQEITTYRVQFGQLGKTSTPIGTEITQKCEALVELFQKHLIAGNLKPLDTYTVVDGQGWEALSQTLSGFETGSLKIDGRKPVVKIADI
ncbi:hypothetical protein V8F06_011055 [Rhypophila decipiens]